MRKRERQQKEERKVITFNKGPILESPVTISNIKEASVKDFAKLARN
jgi:hypothetical protein